MREVARLPAPASLCLLNLVLFLCRCSLPAGSQASQRDLAARREDSPEGPLVDLFPLPQRHGNHCCKLWKERETEKELTGGKFNGSEKMRSARRPRRRRTRRSETGAISLPRWLVAPETWGFPVSLLPPGSLSSECRSQSHEIRTPLHAILALIQILKQDTRISSTQNDLLNTMEDSSELLLVRRGVVPALSKQVAQWLAPFSSSPSFPTSWTLPKPRTACWSSTCG